MSIFGLTPVVVISLNLLTNLRRKTGFRTLTALWTPNALVFKDVALIYGAEYSFHCESPRKIEFFFLWLLWLRLSDPKSSNFLPFISFFDQ